MGRLIKILLAVIAVVIAVVAVRSGYDTGKRVLYPLAYEDLIVKYADENKLDRYLVMAVVKVESNYIPDAHSGKASGLMQLTDETAKWVCQKMGIKFRPEDLMDPEQNVKMGCFYLKYLIDRYEDLDVALAAYNGGMGNVAKWLSDKQYSSDGKTLQVENIPFKETREYVQKVNRNWEQYRQMYDPAVTK